MNTHSKGSHRPRATPGRLVAFLVASALFCLPFGLVWAESAPGVSLPIGSVTVYEDRALVERVGEVDVPAGVSSVRIIELPVGLNEVSLRAAIPAGAKAKVLSVSTRTEEKLETQNEQVRELEKQEEALGRSLRRLDLQANVLNDEAKYVSDFESFIRKGLSERMTLGTASSQELSGATDFLSKRRSALDEKRRQAAVEREDLQEQLGETRKKIGQIATPGRKQVRFADVVIESEAKARIRLSVSYLIDNAWWQPRYEVRLKGGQLDVQYLGEVQQFTGEEWRDVQLILSTARPSLGASPPELVPVRADLAPLTTGKDVWSEAKEIPTAPAAAPPTEAPPAPAEAPAPVEVRDSGVSVVFQLPAKYSVPSERRTHKFPVAAFGDKPELSYETIPKALTYVYLKAKTSNKTTFPMLAGPVDIFRESGFMGTAELAFVAPGKPLEVSLGIDEDLKVRRGPDPKNTTVKTGRKQERRYAFDTELANYKDQKQTVTVLDNYPVSDVEEVKVELLSATTPPTAKEEKHGKLEWKVELAPGEKRVIHLEYVITMPKDFVWREVGDNRYVMPAR